MRTSDKLSMKDLQKYPGGIEHIQVTDAVEKEPYAAEADDFILSRWGVSDSDGSLSVSEG
jgi:hypothetical protein